MFEDGEYGPLNPGHEHKSNGRRDTAEGKQPSRISLCGAPPCNQSLKRLNARTCDR